eukprot:m.758143 g.758143  ORF g.758143 m.758143 type:complete len:431 (+) comp59033_c0_seq3:5141-6433(+)
MSALSELAAQLRELPAAQLHPSLVVLASILRNVVEHPENPKFRQLKIANAQFNAKIWSKPECRDYLLAAGFVEHGEVVQLPDGVYTLEALDLLVASFPDLVVQTSGGYTPPSHPQPEAPVVHHVSEVPTLSLRKPGGSFFDSVKPKMELLSDLVAMGFSTNHASAALIQTKNASIQAALDWMATHAEEPAAPTGFPPVETASNIPTAPFPAASASASVAVPSAKPEEIPMVPMSRAMARLHEGREAVQEAKRLKEMKDIEAARLADIAHRESVKRELQSDRKIFAQKHGMSVPEPAPAATAVKPTAKPAVAVVDASSACLIRIRLPDNSVLSYEGLCGDLARALTRHVVRSAQLASGTFVLLNQTNREVIDEAKTLIELGLAPKGVVIVLKNESKNLVSLSAEPYQLPADPAAAAQQHDDAEDHDDRDDY